MPDAPTFEVIQDGRGGRVVCRYDGEEGAARVFARGLKDACDRAEKQARTKALERQAREAAEANAGG